MRRRCAAAALALALAACPEKKEAAPPSHLAGPVVTRNVTPLPQPTAPAEVEMSGTVDPGGVAAAKLWLVVSAAPCAADATELQVLEKVEVSAGNFFTEKFFKQGTVAHLCLVALDAEGRQVGFAAWSRNPVRFEGQGEVEVKGIELKVSSVPARAGPKGL